MKFTLNTFLLFVIFMLNMVSVLNIPTGDTKKDCKTVTYITARVTESDMNHIRIIHEKHELCI
jgi:hypothetical protein